MTPTQCRMARAAIKWSAADLAAAAGLGYASVARFELGETMRPETINAMRAAFEAKRVRFLMTGQYAGAVVPPPPAKGEDQSANPAMERLLGSVRKGKSGD